MSNLYVNRKKKRGSGLCMFTLAVYLSTNSALSIAESMSLPHRTCSLSSLSVFNV